MNARQRQRRRRRSNAHGGARALLLGGGVTLGALAIAALAVLGWVVGVANSAGSLSSHHSPRSEGTSVVYAANGSRLGFINSNQLQTQVPDGALPKVLKEATVAIEDRRFYQHGAVDVTGTIRAAWDDLTSGSAEQGGSTLTQQLVRNLGYVSKERHVTRKIKEAKLAEDLYDKAMHMSGHPRGREWILWRYLNTVPYGTVGGDTAIGAGAASRVFFDEPVSKLSLTQAALLAGLPQAPSVYNPFLAPKRAKARRNEVLHAMARSDYISAAQLGKALRAPLGVNRNTYYTAKREQFFFDYVRKELVARYGQREVREGGLKVYTTIKPKLQEEARQSIDDKLNIPGVAGVVVTIDPRSGRILAMASSAQYGQGEGQTTFNLASQSHRQPGSSFKPIDLLTAVHDDHADPEKSTYLSAPLSLPPGPLVGPQGWKVHTDDYQYYGPSTLEAAMVRSDNTVYARLGLDVGPKNITQTAHEMGIKSKLYNHAAEAIGGLTYGVSPLEMADAYATLADGGVRRYPLAVTKVVHPNGTVDRWHARSKREFTDGETMAVTKTLIANLDHGTGAGAGFSCPGAGKTGTTSNFTDAWFVGYTPHLSTAVWVGYPAATKSMPNVFGATIPVPIWGEYMAQARGDYCGEFPKVEHPAQLQAWHGKYAFAGAGSDSSGYQNDSGTSTTDGYDSSGGSTYGDSSGGSTYGDGSPGYDSGGAPSDTTSGGDTSSTGDSGSSTGGDSTGSSGSSTGDSGTSTGSGSDSGGDHSYDNPDNYHSHHGGGGSP
jgi:penicillin-binding protein 1A